jgi:hypothetical protein
MMRFSFILTFPFPQAMCSEGTGSEEECSLQCQQKGALCSASRRVLSAVPARARERVFCKHATHCERPECVVRAMHTRPTRLPVFVGPRLEAAPPQGATARGCNFFSLRHVFISYNTSGHRLSIERMRACYCPLSGIFVVFVLIALGGIRYHPTFVNWLANQQHQQLKAAMEDRDFDPRRYSLLAVRGFARPW